MQELQAIFVKDGKWMKRDNAKKNNKSHEIFQCSALSTGFSGDRQGKRPETCGLTANTQ